MNSQLLQYWLVLRIAKWPVLAAIATCAAVICLAGYAYLQQQNNETLSSNIGKLRSQEKRQATSLIPLTIVKPPEEIFESALGRSEHLEQYLRTMFEIAGKQNVNLTQGSYKPHRSIAGNYDTYSIDLPISGPYINIKNISEQMLLALPFSALEEIKFKRKSVSDVTLETQLRFILFLKPVTTIPETDPQP